MGLFNKEKTEKQIENEIKELQKKMEELKKKEEENLKKKQQKEQIEDNEEIDNFDEVSESEDDDIDDSSPENVLIQALNNIIEKKVIEIISEYDGNNEEKEDIEGLEDD
jgi:hypothetical protein